jgi:hypothetical protein
MMAFTTSAFGRKLSSLRADFGQDLNSVAIRLRWVKTLSATLHATFFCLS